MSNPPRLRILSIGPQDVCPPIDGGKESIHGALGALAKHADLSYAFPSRGKSVRESDYLSIGVRPLPIPFDPQDSIATVLSATLRAKPFKFAKYAPTKARTWLSQALGSESFDALLCFHAHSVGLAEGISKHLGWNLPIVLREHNIEFELVNSYLRSAGLAARLAGKPFYWLTRAEEIRIWSKVDSVAFLTDRDLATAKEYANGGRLVLIPEGTPIPPRPPLTSTARDQLLVPLNPRATQSVANLRQFLDEYWPSFAATSVPAEVHLGITGVNICELIELTGLSEHDLARMRVRALGFIPDLASTIAGSLAVVSPTFVGGGIRKKVLEGMANCVPVIATDLDIETCSYFVQGYNILRLGTPKDFVRTVQELARDPVHWAKVAEAGRQTVEKFASWESFGGMLFKEITEQIQQRTQTGP